MRKKHEVRISISTGAEEQHVLTSKRMRIAARIARLLFGEFSEVVILNPGKSVQQIEIHQVRGNRNEK